MRAQRIVFTAAIVLALLLGVAWRLSWRSPPFYEVAGAKALPAPVLTQAQYDAVHREFARPYVVECGAERGRIVLFGSAHTRDAQDPQLAEIERRFAELRPTVTLVEGRPGAPLAALRDPVVMFGEMGTVLRLARGARIPIYSWEPSREAEVQAQLQRFPAERVALFYVLRPYVSERRFGRPKDPDAKLEETRGERTKWKGLEGTLPSIAAVDELWRRDFAGLPDWRDTSDERGWPGYLQAIADASNEIRDEHFARVVIDLLARGERVFAVAGSSHAVKLEPALRAACGEAFEGTLAADGRRMPPALSGTTDDLP
jgi:hypothetical protein